MTPERVLELAILTGILALVVLLIVYMGQAAGIG